MNSMAALAGPPIPKATALNCGNLSKPATVTRVAVVSDVKGILRGHMYCNRCGKEMVFGQQFCAACGAPVADAAVITAGRVQRHIQLLSILWFVYSFFTLLGGGVLLVLANTLFVHLGRGEMRDVPGFLQP